MRQKTLVFPVSVYMMLLCFSSNVFSDAREEFHRTYPVDPGTRVEVMNVNGKVAVSSWNEDYVDVYAEKKTERDREELDRVTIEVTTNGTMEIKTLVRKYNPDEDSFIRRFLGSMGMTSPRVTVDYTIKVPETVSILLAQTVNGSVELSDTQGETSARTTNGGVILNNVKGSVEAHSTNGDITVSGETAVKNASTTNGSIQVSLPEKIGNDARIATTNGSITVSLSPETDADLDVRTTNGSISAEGIEIKLDTISKTHIMGTLGSGGHIVSIRTVNGSIDLNTR